MFCHTHFLAGLLVGVIGYNSGYIHLWDTLIIAILTTLMDIDHFIIFWLKKKSFSLKKFLSTVASEREETYRSFIHKKFFALLILLITIAILFFNKRLAFILGGIYFTHIFLDIISKFKIRVNKYHIIRFMGLSASWSWFENFTLLIILLGLVFGFL